MCKWLEESDMYSNCKWLDFGTYFIYGEVWMMGKQRTKLRVLALQFKLN